MFLENLNNEEKRYFWSMVNYVAKCDNEVSPEEQLMLDAYKKELNIDTTERLMLELDELIQLLGNSTEKVKKSVFIEIIALIMSDNKFEESEKKIIIEMANNFGITSETQSSMFDWVKNMNDLYSQANKLIG